MDNCKHGKYTLHCAYIVLFGHWYSDLNAEYNYWMISESSDHWFECNKREVSKNTHIFRNSIQMIDE